MLHITDEVSMLTDICLCRGTHIPPSEGYENDHPEFEKFPVSGWDPALFVRQQAAFWEVLEMFGVRIHRVPPDPALPWQAYTRDTGFVLGDKLYYAADRQLPERVGEIDALRRGVPEIPPDAFVPLPGRIEGGDVMPDGGLVYVGLGTRTNMEAVEALRAHVDADIIPFDLGPHVMHLDTRMTILPGRRLLVCFDAFQHKDVLFLRDRFRPIEVTAEEARDLATNVFVIDPETVVVHEGHERIAAALEMSGLRVERVDYSEPVKLLGSFRCSTMPLARAG